MCTYRERENTEMAKFLTVGESGWQLCGCSLDCSVNFFVVWSFLKQKVGENGTESWWLWGGWIGGRAELGSGVAELGSPSAWELSLHASELLSAAWSPSLLLQTVFVQAARHMGTGLSRFPAFQLGNREERSVQLCFSSENPGEGLWWPQLGLCTHLWVRKRQGKGAVWPGLSVSYVFQEMRGGLGTSWRQRNQEGKSITYRGRRRRRGAEELRLIQHFLNRVTRRRWGQLLKERIQEDKFGVSYFDHDEFRSFEGI